MTEVDRTAMDRLQGVCEGKCKCKLDNYLTDDNRYIAILQKNISLFNQLKSKLNKEQLTILLDYEETFAIKEEIIIDTLASVVFV